MLPSLFILETVCLIHKLYKTEIVPESTHGTRREYYIPLPIPSTSVIKNSFIYNGKKMFNLLPVLIRIINCGKTFRREGDCLLREPIMTPKNFYVISLPKLVFVSFTLCMIVSILCVIYLELYGILVHFCVCVL